jgi:2-octaprenyl-6-methoxyphenol hydroxylase
MFDVAIVGGGLVGASLAAALRDTGLRIAVIEPFAPDSAAQPSFDERTTALGNASRRVLGALGLWSQLETVAAPITGIHVSDAGRFGFARLEAREFDQDALGYVVPNRVLGRELWAVLRQASTVEAFMPASVVALNVMPDLVQLQIEHGGLRSNIEARLVVGADGARSLVRSVSGLAASVDDYDQVAVVASLKTSEPNDGVAYERFTPAGPMALLPLRVDKANSWRTLVWAARPADATRLMQLPAADFMREWQQVFGWRAGRAVALGHRGSYPLALTRSDATVAPRTVLLGNSAQSLHPVAGQGFNLGLRDVADLAELIAGCKGDVGEATLLARYEALRKADRDGVVRFTDSLVRGFSSSSKPVALARDAGLLLFDLLPPAKRALARVSLGFGSRSPRLARGLSL